MGTDNDYTFSGGGMRVFQGKSVRRTFAKKMQRERQQWLEKAERRFSRELEDAVGEAGLRSSEYWQNYYKTRYDQQMEVIEKQNKEFLEKLQADFRSDQSQYIEQVREAVRQEALEQLDREWTAKRTQLESTLKKAQSELVDAMAALESQLNVNDQQTRELRRQHKIIEDMSVQHRELAVQHKDLYTLSLNQDQELADLRAWKSNALMLMSRHGILDKDLPE